MRIFQNQHKHTYFTNPRIADSIVGHEDYAKRAVELGHGIISTMEHGHQGRYIEGYELAKEHNLKWVFGTEAYWVKDRLEKDSTNAHVCLYAKTENARQCLNDILAEANITGYYYQPRIDLELMLSLPSDEIILSTACIAFWKYGNETEEIIKKLHNHFGNNFYLESQYHLTDEQKAVNKEIVDLSKAYNIGLMMGCDSHYITEDKAWERDEYIKSKGIIYPQEEGWFMDYPDGDTAYNRFIKQGILSPKQIEEAMDNTNIFLDVGEYDSKIFTKDIKMPTLYPEKSQEEKDKLYENLIWEKWEEEKLKIPIEIHSKYEEEIKKEVEDVIATKHADYFLIDYELVKKAVKNGGMITNSGRGSAVSYFTNKLLGFTKIDRISAKVKMYPERFISPTRILESKSLADLDLNTGNPEVFYEAQKEIFGEECSYPMVAYGTMKKKSAWKMYAKAKDIDFEIANKVSEQIEKYEDELKYADEDDEDEIDIYDHIDKGYHEIFRESEIYQGIVDSWSPHPCGYLLYDGNIRREIGLIMIKSKQGKKESLCCLMDGLWAEKYKFLKNDLLKVSVVQLIKMTYQRLGIPEHDEKELLEICENNPKVFDIYKNGWTVGINQFERDGTRNKSMKYAPQNISEVCAFVAAIRPGFKSMYSTFESRKPFSYDIPAFDKLIQTKEMPNSFLLYQEMAMAALNFAGIPMSDCYDVIKNIAKKRAEKVKKYKDQFMNGFKTRLLELEHKTETEAQEATEKVWQIINDSCRYSFNASHAYSVAIDSLYGAYLKSYYPLYFYEVFLNICDEKGDKNRIALILQEAEEAFNIKTDPLRFRQDNRKFTLDESNNSIHRTIKSIKGFGGDLAERLYELRDARYDSFIHLLIDFEELGLLTKKIEILIKLKYFEEFGKNKKLLDIYQEFTKGKNRYNKTHKEGTKEKRIVALREFEEQVEDGVLSIKEQLGCENELLGNPCSTYDIPRSYAYISSADFKYAPRLSVYGLKSGKIAEMKIEKKTFNMNKIEQGDIINIIKHKVKPRNKRTEDGWRPIPGTKEYWITDYTKTNLN